MSGIGDAVKDARQQAADMNDMLAMMSVPEQAEGTAIVDRVARIVSQLAVPFDRPADDDDEPDARARAFAMLIGFERHGTGLRAYDRAGACAPGDVVVGDARTIWLVQSVDADGKAARLIGAAPDEGEALALRWVPEPAARVWTTPETPTAAGLGPSPGAVLSALTGLWSRDSVGGRGLDTPGALLHELARQTGVTVGLAGLKRDADAGTVAAWLRAHGATAIDDAARIAPGDMIWSSADDAAGLVLRAAPTLDILLPGRGAAGPLGEAKGAVRIVRGFTAAPDDLGWRPA